MRHQHGQRRQYPAAVAEADERLSNRDRALALIVPFALVVIALIAVERYHRVDQSPWQGIGFGMFASYEQLPNRTVRAYAVVRGERTQVQVPADLRSELDRVLVAPGDPQARALAEEIRVRIGAPSLILQILGHGVDSTGPGMEISLKELRRVDVP